jgi:hypothetical protein
MKKWLYMKDGFSWGLAFYYLSASEILPLPLLQWVGALTRVNLSSVGRDNLEAFYSLSASSFGELYLNKN